MRQFQSMTRSGEARDFNLIQDNSAYVQNWSIAQALVVILCTAVQVTQTHCITLKKKKKTKSLNMLPIFRSTLSRAFSRTRGKGKGVETGLKCGLDANERFLAVLNRYSHSQCQCVLGNIQCYICEQIQISGIDPYISITLLPNKTIPL